MLPILATTTALLFFAGSALAQVCESYGDDFQNGGSYFQNSLSSDPFTALQEFEGCQNDTANNVLVDPSGDQSQCSNTPLLPDDTPQLITCTDWPKDKLYNGSWSLLIISNNGNGDPIAYERDFSLSVGPQQTTTVTATATITNQITPVVNVTQTSTSTFTTTVPSSTSTVRASVSPTTVTLAPSVARVTKGLITLTQVVQTVQVSSTARTVPAHQKFERISKTPSCVVPETTRVKDPVAQIVPTVLGELDSVASGIIHGLQGSVGNIAGGLIGLGSIRKRSSISAEYKRAVLEGRTPSDELKRAFVEDRNERMAKMLHKRAPDQPTITVTASNVATSTNSQVAATTTQTVTVFVSQTSTLTSGVATVGGAGQRSTVTAAASTRTITVNAPIAIVTSTQTKHTTITNTVTTTSAGAAQSCASKRGHLA
ncbi:hypothetical protein B0A55_09011 [Friedmanniomyces simplex]|uniref:Uncharacterized protein n=1 Tax=Friedmanniomyces simplex TaxID=329884 RepID=A0A4U0WR77_9PEZI|nr:hypothetical protein B0A55_09011 [Friedmanniomyces simplex]